MRWTRARVVGAIAGGVLAGGAVLAAGVASAQTPTPSPQPGQPGQPGQQGQQPGGASRMNKGDYAAKLAQALNIPQARVEDALRQLKEQRPDKMRGGAALAQAAATLGVTEQQLSDAIQAARAQAGAATPGTPGQGPRDRTQRPDRTAFFNAIAQQLGGGITGDQVRDALRPNRAAGANRPDRAEIEARAEQHLQTFAGLLGVSVDQLRAAIQSIGGPGGPGGRGPGMHGRGR